MAGFRVKIHNHSNEDYCEHLNHKDYRIPANGFVEMTRSEGVALMGSYPGKGVPKPLRLEHIPNKDAMSNRHICNLCGMEYTDLAQLNMHLKTHSGTFGTSAPTEPGKAEPAQPAQPTTVRIYVCAVCGTEHTDKESLTRCMGSHKKSSRKKNNDTRSSVPVGSK
jgi:hypothetical protein